VVAYLCSSSAYLFFVILGALGLSVRTPSNVFPIPPAKGSQQATELPLTIALASHTNIGAFLGRQSLRPTAQWGDVADFASWLRAQANPDPETAALRAFADPRGDWPWWTNRLSDYVAAIQAANPPNKDDLISAVSLNFGRWQAGQARPGGLLATLASHLGALLLALFGLVVAVAIFYGLFFNPKFFELMAQVNQARGLITFLFAFATIAIILLVAITTFWMPKDEVQIRFEKAKDLLTILIGVMGTILGFYFGTVTSNPPAATTNTSAISAPGDQSGAGGPSH
jgi:hypothetical protein